MNVINSYRFAGSGFEPEYQAVLNYAISNSIPTPDQSQNEINNAIIKNCKTEGIWNWDVFYFFKQPSGLADFTLINWANPNNHNATTVNSPDYIANSGWKNTSGTSYLRTNFIPNADSSFVSTDFSMFAKMFNIETTYVNTTILLGGREANNTNQVLWFNSPNGRYQHRTSESGSFSDIGQANMNTLLIRSNSTTQSYRDFPELLINDVVASTIGGLSQVELYLLGFNNNGTASFGRNPGIEYFGWGNSIIGKSYEFNHILKGTY